MGILRRLSRGKRAPAILKPTPLDPGASVDDFLRGQNLEQVGKVEQAIERYEAAVERMFDAAGPYDRLIWIYRQAGRYKDVIRIAEHAIKSVPTYPEKRAFWARMMQEAGTARGGGAITPIEKHQD